MGSIVGAGGGHALFHTGHEQVAGSEKPASAGHLGLAAATSGFEAAKATANFAGGHGGTEHVVASHSQAGGNVIVHMHDGSTLTVVGVTHIDASFFR
jgi:hypothetical protein